MRHELRRGSLLSNQRHYLNGRLSFSASAPAVDLLTFSTHIGAFHSHIAGPPQCINRTFQTITFPYIPGQTIYSPRGDPVNCWVCDDVLTEVKISFKHPDGKPLQARRTLYRTKYLAITEDISGLRLAN